MGNNHGKLPDTPWHIGYAKMAEGDTKRHKARCIYYDNQNKYCITAKSPCCGTTCGGSAHCGVYSEKKAEIVTEKVILKPKTENKRRFEKSCASKGDIVEIKCVEDNCIKKYQILDNYIEMQQLYIGKNVGYRFLLKGKAYVITKIEGYV